MGVRLNKRASLGDNLKNYIVGGLFGLVIAIGVVFNHKADRGKSMDELAWEYEFRQERIKPANQNLSDCLRTTPVSEELKENGVKVVYDILNKTADHLNDIARDVSQLDRYYEMLEINSTTNAFIEKYDPACYFQTKYSYGYDLKF